jgi:hypothetical protein
MSNPGKATMLAVKLEELEEGKEARALTLNN